MAKKRGKAVKAQKLKHENEPETLKKSPHSFVFHRGLVGKYVLQLVQDLRQVMEPYTAVDLKVRKKNSLKDFMSVAGIFNVSHFIIFTKSEIYVRMRIICVPRGPTLSFNVQSYTNSRDVRAALRKSESLTSMFMNHPLLVLNNFSGDGMHIKLMATVFQNMFPSININKVKLNSIRRCVLVDYDKEANMVEIRHYCIKVVPMGLSRGVKKLTKPKIPDMSRYEDISDFVERGGNLSESEGEMDAEHEVTLPQDMSGAGNVKHGQSAIRLKEIGPRLRLQLVKIEEGISSGPVMFHQFVSKTSDEIKERNEAREKRESLKQSRKAHQDSNVKRKKESKDAHKEKSLAGMKRKADADPSSKEAGDSDSDAADLETAPVQSDDDDVEYYKKAVGSAPDKDLFPVRSALGKRKKSSKITIGGKTFQNGKRVRPDSKGSASKGTAPKGTAPKPELKSRFFRKKKQK